MIKDGYGRYLGEVGRLTRMGNETEDSVPRVITAHCPNCRGMRNAYVRGEHVTKGSDDEDGTSWSDTGMVLECGGCLRVFFRRDYWFSEWEAVGEHPVTGESRLEGGVETTYWPAPATRKPPKSDVTKPLSHGDRAKTEVKREG